VREAVAGRFGGACGGSGGDGATWRGEEGPAEVGKRWVRCWRSRGTEKSGAGQFELGKTAGEGSGVTGARQSRRDWR
jgi:hypothetical protein